MSKLEVHRRVVNHAARGDSRPAMTREELEAETKSAEELRAEADKQLKAERWKEVGPQVHDRISAVLETYPWYRDTIRNGQVIAAKLSTAEAIQERRRQHREDNDYSALEIAGAVEEARAKGELDINEAAASKERIGEYREQLAGLSRTEDDLYSMPMSRLRALANGIDDTLGPQ